MDIQKTLIELFGNYKKIEELHVLTKQQMSDIDKELSNFYHRIEGTHLSHNTQGHGLILQLQDILERRRKLKLEVNLVKSFMAITDSSMRNAIKKNNTVINAHKSQLKEISDTGGVGYDGKNNLKISLD